MVEEEEEGGMLQPLSCRIIARVGCMLVVVVVMVAVSEAIWRC